MSGPALRVTTIVATIIIVGCPVLAARPLVSDSVRAAMQDAAPSASIDLILNFDHDLDYAALKAARAPALNGRRSNYRMVMQQLTANRDRLEADVAPVLKAMQVAGTIASYRFYTVSRTVFVRTRADNVENLLALPGLTMVNYDHAVSLIQPVEDIPVTEGTKAALANTALETIHVRSLWERGLTGTGRLICSFDTGIDGDHPALSAKWRGASGVASSAAWFAPRGDSIPQDKIGHGTHVMGIMLGSTDTDTIGVAPGAQWISAAVIDQGASFTTTLADIMAAFDWALNPDGDPNTLDDLPDVICNSWGIPRGILGDCDQTFWTAIDNVEAAGIVAIFAAGNEGPNPGTMRHPADRASSPSNTLSVGAIDPQTLVVADFSSRGPAGCDGMTIKPELVAPGVEIYSSYKDGGYRLMSGTSMSTPFVAGLAALMRQYNPDATVAQIKQALLAAVTDLGPAGEDNDYGYGLIDASRVLDFLAPPSLPKIAIFKSQIASGRDSFADPGETALITLTLNEPSGSVDSIDAWLTSSSNWLMPGGDTIRFHFAEGATYAVSLNAFPVAVSPDAVCGQIERMVAHFRYLRGAGEDSASFFMLIGHEIPGNLFSVHTGDLSLTVSEFGQLGLGERSIYPAGGVGFRFQGGANLLYEGGLIVGRTNALVSDGIRGADGEFQESDFLPIEQPAIAAAVSEESVNANYADDHAALPIPVQVTQTVYGSDQNFIVMAFDVYNPTPSWVEGLAFGLLFDFDLDRFHDRIGFDTLIGMFYQYDAAQNIYIGLAGVSANEFAVTALTNPESNKAGISEPEKYGLVNATGITLASATEADWYMVVSRRAGRMEGFGKRTLAVVLAAATSVEELRYVMLAGMDAYHNQLDADEETTALPMTAALSQNYPNPFNPRTTIRFSLPAAQQARLCVYNTLGQMVRVLHDGTAAAGEYLVEWDGCDESGRTVASGVYFYRLTAETETITRKMVFLK
jgi:subtilisin family serine protease